MMSCMILTSCQRNELLYSCNSTADRWVKNNLSEIQTMTRSSWLKLEESDPIKKAAYVAFTPDTKRNFWIDKISEVINQFNWNEKEREHLSLLLDYVQRSNIFAKSGIDNDFELFVYRWNDYAINELKWPRTLIYAITASGDKLIDTKGNTLRSAIGVSNQNSVMTMSETEDDNCWCSQKSDWCDIFGEIPDNVVSCNRYNWNCKIVSGGCGSLWYFDCDGVCKSPML